MATKRSTSRERQVRNMQNVASPVEPPDNAQFMNKHARTIFDQLAQGKAKDDWFVHELYQLVALARLTVRMERNLRILEYEGPTLISSTGNKVSNPLNSICATQAKQQMSMMRLLNLSSNKTQKVEQNTHRANKENEVRRNLPKHTGLLAVPK